jgi:hypothetical protein
MMRRASRRSKAGRTRYGVGQVAREVGGDQAPDPSAEDREDERHGGEGHGAHDLARESPAERQLALQHRLVEPVHAAHEQDRGQDRHDGGELRLAEEGGERRRGREQEQREQRARGEQQREDRALRPRVHVAPDDQRGPQPQTREHAQQLHSERRHREQPEVGRGEQPRQRQRREERDRAGRRVREQRPGDAA